MFTFVETPVFTRLVGEYLSDDEFLKLQVALSENPNAGAIIPNSGGIRNAVVDERTGIARRSTGYLLCTFSSRRDLDAYVVSEERSGKYSGACVAADSEGARR